MALFHIYINKYSSNVYIMINERLVDTVRTGLLIIIFLHSIKAPQLFSMMLNMVVVYLFNRGANEAKLENFGLLDQVVGKGGGKGSQASKPVFTRPSGMKRSGQVSQDSKLVFTRPIGLNRAGQGSQDSKLVFTSPIGLERGWQGSQDSKPVFTSPIGLERGGQVSQDSKLVFTRPSGLKRGGQGSQASKLVFTRPSGLCEDGGSGRRPSAHNYLQDCQMINILLGCLSKIR